MSTHRTRAAATLSAIALAMMGLALSAPAVAAAEPAVGLGRAESYVVVAGTTVTNTGPSVVNGSLGVSPGTALTGWPPGIVQAGSIHSADEQVAGAQADLLTAWIAAAGRSTNVTVSADLAGQTLVGGVYTGTALALNGTLTLDAQGVPGTVWIFQAASTVITGPNSTVALVNGADACNVFWQVGSSATIGTGTEFVGTVMALTSITADTDASVTGRLLARNGAVTLDSNVITRPTCAVDVTTTLPDTTTTLDDTTTTAPETTTTVPETPTTLPDTTTTAPDTTTTAPDTTTTVPATTTTSLGDTTTTSPGDTTTTTAGPVTTTTIEDTDTTVVETGVTSTTLGGGTIPAPVATTSTQPSTGPTIVDDAASPPNTLSPAQITPNAPTTAPATPSTYPELPRTGSGLDRTAMAASLALLLGLTCLRGTRRLRAALS